MQIWNIKSILEWAINYFKSRDISQPRLSAELLLSSVVNLDRMNLYLNYNRVLNKNELALYKKYILKRLEKVPIQYILSEAYFRKIKLHVDDRVLIPRSETELIVDKAFQILKENYGKKKINIMEIGTGSGAISISIAYEISGELKIPPELWEIIATDNNQGALEVAEKNAGDVLGSSENERVKFIECDLLPAEDSDFSRKYKNKINLIISNPPYISEEDYKKLPSEVKDYEPEGALLAGKTGLEVYEKILYKVKPYISTDFCYILFEIEQTKRIPLEKIAKDIIKPSEITVDEDYNQRDRIMAIKV